MRYNGEMKNTKNFWRVGKVVDWWSIPHFLFGVVMALGALVFAWPLPFAFVGTFAIAFMWEKFERSIRIQEAKENSRMDILLPLLAFGITIFLMNQMPSRTDEDEQTFFLTAVFLYLFLNFIAWRAKLENDREFQG